MNEQALFTFLVEYKGGTYIKQVKASNVSLALNIWRTEALEELAELSQTSPSNFAGFNSNIVQLDGCVNVWCLTLSFDGELLLMNIVATAGEAKSEGKAI